MSSVKGSTHNTTNPIDRAITIHQDTYDYSLFVYKTMNTKSTIVCNDHGPFQRSMAEHIYSKAGCPGCSIKNMLKSRTGKFARWDTEKFISKAREIHGDLYDYKDVVYINAHTKVAIGCKVHGNWMIMPTGHIRGNGGMGHGCPMCTSKMSAPEKRICKVLDAHNISYKYQHPFPDLRSELNRVLFYDFYLLDYNIIIEYDGVQHTKNTTLYPGLERRQVLDGIKNQYAIDNNIQLIRIPHTVGKHIDQFVENLIMQLLQKHTRDNLDPS